MPEDVDGGVSLGAYGDLLELLYKAPPARSGTLCRGMAMEAYLLGHMGIC